MSISAENEEEDIEWRFDQRTNDDLFAEEESKVTAGQQSNMLPRSLEYSMVSSKVKEYKSKLYESLQQSNRL